MRHAKKTIVFLIFLFFFILVLIPFSYPYLFYNPPKKEEIIVIGLEGGTWRVIKPSIEKDELPNLKFLIENGAHGTINSSIQSYQVWSHIARGKSQESESLWEIASEKNKTVISHYWPNSIKGEIYDLKGFYLLMNPILEFFKKFYYLKILVPTNKVDKDLVYDFYILDYRMREFFYSREKLKPDLSGLVLPELPRLQLYFWMYREPERFQNVSEDGIEKYGKVIEEYYKEFDSYLGNLIKEKNTTIIIVSGYGFDATIPQKVIDKILVNKILEVGGLLRFDYKGEIDLSKEDIKTRVIDLFSNVYVGETKKPVFDVFESDKDLVLRRKVPLQINEEKIMILNKRYPIKDFILRRIVSGRTTEEGIFIMYGNDIEKEEIRDATIYDIAPTILHLLNISIPNDMEGKALM
ncbi:MAG: alkaline phosphatase family protein [Candidatus Aenigmarchaeota archaeon]|nr:alkaline phosphatase family protein [Candidatus Aenigmarchaeota archaeon]